MATTKIRTYTEEGYDDKDVYARPLGRGKVELVVSWGCDAAFATLTSKDVEELISMLKQVRKKSMASK